MQRTRLGQSGLEISRVVFGSMGHGSPSSAERTRVIHAALDAGITSFDTAPLYGFGEVEKILGGAIRDRRDRVELLSKVGLRWDSDHGDVLFESTDPSGKRRVVRRDSRPDAIRKDVEESLVRLQTDRIDLCQIHQPDRTVSIGETMGALEDLVTQGKILHIGVSNFSPSELEAALRSCSRYPLASDQLEYNLLARHAEEEILPLARAHHFGILAYSPLDAGSLADRTPDREVHDGRRERPSFRPANAQAIQTALRDCVLPAARAHGASQAQICLAWLLHQDAVSGIVAGARTIDQVAANAHSCEIRLDDDEVDVIGRRFSEVRIRGRGGFGRRVRMLWRRATTRWISQTRRP